MFPPKYFDNFSPEGGCSEGLDAFRFFLKTLLRQENAARKILPLQPMIPPKRFDISPHPDWGMLRRSKCVQIFLSKLCKDKSEAVGSKQYNIEEKQ